MVAKSVGQVEGRVVTGRLRHRVYAIAMRVSLFVLLAAAGLAAGQAVAGDLTVSVRTASGAPIVDAVVTVQPSTPRPRPAKFAQPLRLAQHDLHFEPFVLVIPVGAEVGFPNEDHVRHQVYSFSGAKSFELRLYGRDESRSVKFDKVGVVALGCNIHDSMSAFIKVTDAPYAAKTDASGRVTLRDLPAGDAVVKVWHPYLKAPANEMRLDATLPADGVVTREVRGDLRTPPMRMSAY